MTNSPTITIRVPSEIKDAIEAACQKRGESVAQLLLRAACNEIGRSDLAETIREKGRPKKGDS